MKIQNEKGRERKLIKSETKQHILIYKQYVCNIMAKTFDYVLDIQISLL